MKKENKKFNSIVLIVITLLMSSLIFTNRVDAKTVMSLVCHSSAGYCDICGTDNKMAIAYVTNGVSAIGEGDKVQYITFTNFNDVDFDDQDMFNIPGDYRKDITRVSNLDYSSSKISNCYSKESEFGWPNTHYYIGTDSNCISKYPGLISMVDDGCWIDGSSDVAKKCEDTSKSNPKTYISEGYCPIRIRREYEGSKVDHDQIFAGQTSNNGIGILNDMGNFVIYSFDDEIIFEGYYGDGMFFRASDNYGFEKEYGYLSFYSTSAFKQKSLIYTTSDQISAILNFDDIETGVLNYFKVDEFFEAQTMSYVHSVSEEEAINEHNYEVIASSYGDGYVKLGNLINEALIEVSSNDYVVDAMTPNQLAEEKKQLINIISDINTKGLSNESYYFSSSSNYNRDSFVEDLKIAYRGIVGGYSDANSYLVTGGKDGEEYYGPMDTAVINKLILTIFDVKEADFEKIGDDDYSLNRELGRSVFDEYVNKYLKESGLLTLDEEERDKLIEYAIEFYKALSYISTNPYAYNLSENNKKILFESAFDDGDGGLFTLFENFIIYAGYDVPRVTCRSLIGSDLYNKLMTYVNAIKIAIPILLIAFGIIDFTKAMFSNNDEQMEKAKKTFIKRLSFAILIFFIPTIVDLILRLGSKVWTTISPDSCGLF